MNAPLVGVAVSNSRAALVALAVAGLRVVLASGLVGGKPGGPQPADRLHESARATVELEGTMPYPPDRLWAHFCALVPPPAVSSTLALARLPL